MASAIEQLGAVDIAPDADLVALAKPMFELGLSAPPHDQEPFDEAVSRASAAAEAHGWRVKATVRSPVRGARGAVEFLLHAIRRRGR